MLRNGRSDLGLGDAGGRTGADFRLPIDGPPGVRGGSPPGSFDEGNKDRRVIPNGGTDFQEPGRLARPAPAPQGLNAQSEYARGLVLFHQGRRGVRRGHVLSPHRRVRTNYDGASFTTMP